MRRWTAKQGAWRRRGAAYDSAAQSCAPRAPAQPPVSVRREGRPRMPRCRHPAPPLRPPAPRPRPAPPHARRTLTRPARGRASRPRRGTLRLNYRRAAGRCRLLHAAAAVRPAAAVHPACPPPPAHRGRRHSCRCCPLRGQPGRPRGCCRRPGGQPLLALQLGSHLWLSGCWQTRRRCFPACRHRPPLLLDVLHQAGEVEQAGGGAEACRQVLQDTRRRRALSPRRPVREVDEAHAWRRRAGRDLAAQCCGAACRRAGRGHTVPSGARGAPALCAQRAAGTMSVRIT